MDCYLFITFWLVLLLFDRRTVATLVCSSLFSTKSGPVINFYVMWFEIPWKSTQYLSSTHLILSQNLIIWLWPHRDDCSSECLHWSVTVQLYTQVPAC